MKVTLNDVGNLIDATTAATTINANSNTIETAFDNTLSRDGTAPNQMQSELDMNSKQIINLPNPATAASPLRLQDLNTFVGGGTVTNIPSGGTTGQVIAKNSNANFDIGYRDSVTSVGLALPADLTVTNSPVTTTGTLTGAWATPPTGTGAMVRANQPTLTGPLHVQYASPGAGAWFDTSALTNRFFVGTDLGTDAFRILTSGNGANTLTIAGPTGNATFARPTTFSSGLTNVGNLAITGGALVIAGGTSGTATLQPSAVASGTLTLPAATDTLVGKATTDTLTNKTLGALSGDISFSGSGNGIVGTTTNNNANAGNVGEYVESVVVSGSAVALVTGTAKTVTSISLTAGDWDVDAIGYIAPAATTNVTNTAVSISGTTNTFDGTPGKANGFTTTGVVTGGPSLSQVIPSYRLSLSGTTSVFLVCQATFTVSTASAFGIIRARRVR